MNPLLWNGDGLHIVPYDGRAIRPGDVIVFVPPGRETRVVHRVASCSEQGVRTRGDNARVADPWILAPDDILGRVDYIQRGSRRKKITGGSMGRAAAVWFRCRRVLYEVISFLCHPVYDRLCQSAFIKRRLHLLLKPRVLSFSRAGGTELYLVLGRRPIGRRHPGKETWDIRRPYRLCVDERLLSGYLTDGTARESRSPLF